MSLRTNDTLEKKKTVTTEPEKSESSHSDDDRFTTPSEDVALSPKRQNQKSTSPALAPQKKIDSKAPIGAYKCICKCRAYQHNQRTNRKQRGTKRKRVSDQNRLAT